MSRYIDADALKEAVYRSGIDNQADISTLIEDQPTADVEEVVRCKDCRFWWLNNGKIHHEFCMCPEDEFPNADDYCSRGERREE